MPVSKKRMLQTLKKMDYVRLSTKDGEKDGAKVIAEELRLMNAFPVFEEFSAPAYKIHEAKLEVVSPFLCEYHVSGYGFSGNAAKDGITAEFVYAENCDNIELYDVKGKIALVSGRVEHYQYEKLVKNGAVGFIGISGTFCDKPDNTDLDEKMLRWQHTRHGVIPGVCIRMADAIKLIRSKPEKVRLVLSQTEGEAPSQNIIYEIKGTKYPDEVIVYTAHYDSVVFSHGMYDNASGSVILLEICRHFIENPPERTLRFIWCGSEERGLLGSKAYVKTHEEELKNIRFCINVDMAGVTVGRDIAIVTAEDRLCHYLEYYNLIIGHPSDIRQDIYSSDSIPFANAGIPAVNFSRFASPGGAELHSRRDVFSSMDGDALAKTAAYVIGFSEQITSAKVFPVKREIPQSIVERIDKYLFKETKK